MSVNKPHRMPREHRLVVLSFAASMVIHASFAMALVFLIHATRSREILRPALNARGQILEFIVIADPLPAAAAPKQPDSMPLQRDVAQSKPKPWRPVQPKAPPSVASSAEFPAEGSRKNLSSEPAATVASDRRIDEPAAAPIAAPTESQSGGAGTPSAPPYNHPQGTPNASPSSSEAHPDYLRNPPPAYPGVARRRRIEGLVLLQVRVDEHGSAAAVALKQSSGHEALDGAALRAVRDWVFVPATRDGVPVASVVEVPIRFQLSETTARR